MKIGTRIGIAVGAMAVGSVGVVVAFFAMSQYLGRQAIQIYDGPLMAISYARSAYANALIAS